MLKNTRDRISKIPNMAKCTGQTTWGKRGEKFLDEKKLNQI